MYCRCLFRCALVCGVAVLLGAIACTGPNDADSVGTSSTPTGSLRVLITDKPYPIELLEKAEVTITRVEVRLVHADTNGGCQSDVDCSDALFCNGMETCASNGLCQGGSSPCADGEVCNEDTDTCGLCTNGLDCDDGVFCNGSETCGTNGLCADGDPPCAAGEVCDEDADSCGLCGEDADCDDGLFCNGTESCGSNGLCQPGENPCLEGETCLEDLSTCGPPTGDPNDDEGEQGNPFIVVFEGNKVFDLLELQNGQTDLLADAEVPAGRYSLMRLIVTQGEVTLVGGRVFLLDVPSGEQTGIKLHYTFDVTSGEETTLVLDVDLSRAFQPIPGGKIEDVDSIRNFKFTPSVAMRLIDLPSSGNVAGKVTDADSNPIADILVTAYQSDDEVTSTFTDADGAYFLMGLPAGDYRLQFSGSGFADTQITDVAVDGGGTTELADVMLEEPEA